MRRIDVFIPYHTSLKYLPACIDSILWQKDVKAIIHLVNDCSPEDDQFLLERYQSFAGVRWYKTKQNVGPYQIWNALVAKMQADHFALMGSDDISLPSRLRVSFDQMYRDNADVFFAGMENFLSPDQPANSEDREFVERKPFYQSALNGVLVNGTMVISKRAFVSVNGFENVFCGGDSEFSERLKRSGLTISISPQCVALRRIHGNNLSNQNGPKGLNSSLRRQISQRWQRRFQEWKHDFDVTRYGGLRSVSDILVELSPASPKTTALVPHFNQSQATLAGANRSLPTVQSPSIVRQSDSQGQVQFPEGVFVGQEVSLGENIRFLPNNSQPGRLAWRPTHVHDGARIGDNCVILPGVTIGPNCDIAPGTVVNCDVADNSLGGGTPYQQRSRTLVTVGIATYPPRLSALPDTIESLHDQVDQIHVCLNEYDHIPTQLTRYKKVICTIPDQNLTDLGKFLQLSGVSGYFFSCDDDLIYPANYVTKTITQLRKHGGVVSYLGRVFPRTRKCESYYKDTIEYYHCLREVEQDHQVHVVGTGVMCFHTDDVDFTFDDFRRSGMADVQFGVYAARNRIKLTALKHPQNWLQHTRKIDLQDTIYSKNKDNDRIYTDAINQVDWSLV